LAVVSAGLGLVAMSPATVAFAQGSVPLSTATPALQELGRKAQDRSIPEAERLGLIRGLAHWNTEQIREPMDPLLQDPLPAPREAAARALGGEGSGEAVAPLRARIELPSEVPAVKVAALESLGKIGDDAGRDVALAATKDPDQYVRGAALAAVTTG